MKLQIRHKGGHKESAEIGPDGNFLSGTYVACQTSVLAYCEFCGTPIANREDHTLHCNRYVPSDYMNYAAHLAWNNSTKTAETTFNKQMSNMILEIAATEPTRVQVIEMKKQFNDDVDLLIWLASEIGNGKVTLEINTENDRAEFTGTLVWRESDKWVFQSQRYGESFRVYTDSTMLIDVHFDKLDAPRVKIYVRTTDD